MGSPEEHRHHRRHHAPSDVALTLRRETGNDAPLQLLCRDVSRNGLGVTFPQAIRPDTDVELWVSLPDRDAPLHLFGTVAWCAAPLGHWRAGIALDLERSDGQVWRARFDDTGP